MANTPPKYVKNILQKLEAHGFSAFLVGGCVRDIIIGRRPHDWDVTTSALPDEIMNIFPGSLPTGIKHGTVTVVSGRGRVEVTTFRSDGTYSDHRRPDNVSYISGVTGDLERRDFTINAMALPLSGIIVDPFRGADDLKTKTIRCVGDPERRFSEDALRMFRALRFSAQLGFDIENRTADAIYSMAHTSALIAPERISFELEKILMSPNPEIIGRVLRYGLLDHYLARPRVSTPYRRLENLPKNKQQRWAAFCAILESRQLIESTEKLLSSLRLDNATIRNCSAGTRIALGEELPGSRLEWKRVLADYGVDTAFCAAAAAYMLTPANHMREVKSILKSGECFSLRRLAVNGDDLIAPGFKGAEIGDLLNAMLYHVLEYPEDNEKEKLMSLFARNDGNPIAGR